MSLSAGAVVGGCLECPYHGWRYGSDGSCRHVPALPIGGRPPAQAKVRPYPVQETDDFVWVWMGEDPPQEDPYRFHSYKRHGWDSFRVKARFPAPVEACLENLLDAPRRWFPSQQRHEVTAVVRRGGQEAEVEFRDEHFLGGLIGRWLRPRGASLRRTDRFIVPNVSRADYQWDEDHHLVMSSQCTPVGRDDTLVYTVVSFRFGRWSPALRWMLEPVFRSMVLRDMRGMEDHARRRGRAGPPRLVTAESDLLCRHIQAMRAAAARGGLEEEAAALATRTVHIRL